MKNMARLLAFALAIAPVLADAQQFPATMPSQTVYGRLGVTPGPGQPVPITSLLSAASQSPANRVFAGPTSGGTGAATFRSLVFGDLPSVGAATFIGNPNSTSAAPQTFTIPGLPNLTSPSATLDFLPIYDHATGTLKYINLSQIPTQASPLGANNTWTGMNDFQGGATFGGQPWFSVKSAAHGCGVAAGNGSTDDTSAIQCHINYMFNTYGGGIVFFPQGNYHVTATLNVPQATWLEGAGAWTTAISASTDIGVLSFSISLTNLTSCPVGNHYGGMEKIAVDGYANAAATQNTVIVQNGCNVTLRDDIIWYGANALFNKGADGLVEGSFIWGYGSALVSNGANWYVRDKFDQVGSTGATHAYLQGTSVVGTPAENHFVECDFSGTYTDSVNINDTTNAITIFEGSIFSSPISIAGKVTIFSAAEFGSSIAGSSGFLNIVGSYAFSSTAVTGLGARSCAGNAQISC